MGVIITIILTFYVAGMWWRFSEQPLSSNRPKRIPFDEDGGMSSVLYIKTRQKWLSAIDWVLRPWSSPLEPWIVRGDHDPFLWKNSTMRCSFHQVSWFYASKRYHGWKRYWYREVLIACNAALKSQMLHFAVVCSLCLVYREPRVWATWPRRSVCTWERDIWILAKDLIACLCVGWVEMCTFLSRSFLPCLAQKQMHG